MPTRQQPTDTTLLVRAGQILEVLLERLTQREEAHTGGWPTPGEHQLRALITRVRQGIDTPTSARVVFLRQASRVEQDALDTAIGLLGPRDVEALQVLGDLRSLIAG